MAVPILHLHTTQTSPLTWSFLNITHKQALRPRSFISMLFILFTYRSILNIEYRFKRYFFSPSLSPPAFSFGPPIPRTTQIDPKKIRLALYLQVGPSFAADLHGFQESNVPHRPSPMYGKDIPHLLFSQIPSADFLKNDAKSWPSLSDICDLTLVFQIRFCLYYSMPNIKQLNFICFSGEA